MVSPWLLLPPGYNEPIPSDYIPVRFNTYNGYSILRAIPVTNAPKDVAKALELVKETRVYRLAQAANPPPQRHIDMAGKLFDGIAAFDDRFYESLARTVNEEPVQLRDIAIMGRLQSIGIVKGQEFRPDGAMRQTLKKAVAEAQAGFHAIRDLAPDLRTRPIAMVAAGYACWGPHRICL
jgi:hypothetical protein